MRLPMSARLPAAGWTDEEEEAGRTLAGGEDAALSLLQGIEISSARYINSLIVLFGGQCM